MAKQLTGPLGMAVPKIKAESETQTPNQTKSAGRSMSLKDSQSDAKLIQEQALPGSSSIKRRRNISKNRQGVKQREKTPEPSKVSIPHEDTTTTDEEENRNSREIEADDTYEEMRRLVMKKTGEKDDDDIDVEELREQRKRAEQDRRRRSISPYSKPSPEELAQLQRRSSYIDPDNKLLGAVPIYTLGPKGENEHLLRKHSLNLDPRSEHRNSLSVPSTPSTPGSPPNENKFPFPKSSSPKSDKIMDANFEKPKNIFIDFTPSPSPSPDPTRKNIENVPLIAKEEKMPSKSQSKLQPLTPHTLEKEDASQPKGAPVKPARSKSTTRSDGKTSESEISGDKRTVESNIQTRTPKPKERRKTIAAIKRNAREISNQKRSQSASRANNLDNSQPKVEMSKTSSEIMDLLRKRSLSIPKEGNHIYKEDFVVEENRRLVTPCRTPETPKSKYIRSQKKIQLIKATDILESLTTAQRLELEMETSRRSSGYIEASQSEYTSSCYSSSFDSEDDYDFDLSKKTAELNRKLTELSIENEELKAVVRRRGVKNKNDDENDEETKKKEDMDKRKTETKPKVPPKTKIGRFFYIVSHLWGHWSDFKDLYKQDYVRIRLLINKCVCDVLVLLIFCGLGGFMFRYAEGAFENLYKCNAKRVKRDFIDTLWQGVHRLHEDDWKSMARRKLWEFENQLLTAHEAGVRSNSGLNSWNFMNSVVYCLTVVTTIGYGHIAPSTTAGRIATIVYAVIGIPMFLIVLADFGKLFTRCIKFFWAFVRRLYYTGSCKKVRRTVPVQDVMKGWSMMLDVVRRPSQIVDMEAGTDSPQLPPQLPPKPGPTNLKHVTIPNITKNDDSSTVSEPHTPAPSVFEIDDEFNLPISVAVTILVVYIFIGAVVYNFWETWGFFEAFYFVFISMSTIGFGDYVPQHPMYMMASIIYLIFGLALTSMCINVVQVKLSDSFRQASAKIGATIGLKVLEEDGSLVPVTPPTVEMPGVHGATKPSIEESKDEIR